MSNRNCIFALSEGEAIISYPEKLSVESYFFLNEFLSVFMKSLKRQTEEAEQKQAGDEK